MSQPAEGSSAGFAALDWAILLGAGVALVVAVVWLIQGPPGVTDASGE